MPRASYDDLVLEVTAQIAVDEERAFAWLLDRARVLNAETAWLFTETDLDSATDMDGRYHDLPEDLIWVEAVIVSGVPYWRSTLHALDARWSGRTGNTHGIYADSGAGVGALQVHPPATVPPVIRYVQDIPEARGFPPPFPADFDQALVDGAVAIGLARMDERFDSASYFDQRFQNAIQRLGRRRRGHAGRGPTFIRTVT